MAESSPSRRPALSRGELIHIAVMLSVGAASGLALLVLLLPTWEDARTALAFALGRSAQDINEAVRDAPLPPLPPGPAGPIRPLPARPVVRLQVPDEEVLGGGPTPPTEGANRQYAYEFEMQKRQYQFYMEHLRRARDAERRHRQAQAEARANPPPSDSRP
jgi:hypothetical protein